jgi:hypothetical protein
MDLPLFVTKVLPQTEQMRSRPLSYSRHAILTGGIAVNGPMPRNLAGWLALYTDRYGGERAVLGPRSGQRGQAPPHGLQGRK